jgi:hypothetical protein
MEQGSARGRRGRRLATGARAMATTRGACGVAVNGVGSSRFSHASPEGRGCGMSRGLGGGGASLVVGWSLISLPTTTQFPVPTTSSQRHWNRRAFPGTSSEAGVAAGQPRRPREGGGGDSASFVVVQRREPRADGRRRAAGGEPRRARAAEFGQAKAARCSTSPGHGATAKKQKALLALA